MTRTDAEKAVRERWERLGLDWTKHPLTFQEDIENMLAGKVLAAYRKQTGETGRSAVQFSDPAGE